MNASLDVSQSLAVALYFAARGIGKVRSYPEAEATPYMSTARVLLNGLGSDELLGGYGRHRTAFRCGGWQAVVDEVSHLNNVHCSSIFNYASQATIRDRPHTYKEFRKR